MSAVYVCHNRKPLRDARVVQCGWHAVNWHNTKARLDRTITDPMSKDCQYTNSKEGLVDPKCSGCKHKAELAAPE